MLSGCGVMNKLGNPDLKANDVEHRLDSRDLIIGCVAIVILPKALLILKNSWG